MQTFVEAMVSERDAAYSMGDKYYACRLVSHRKGDPHMGYRMMKDANGNIVRDEKPVRIYDDTPKSYLNSVVNGIMSAVTPEDQMWFQITTYGAATAKAFQDSSIKAAKEKGGYRAESMMKKVLSSNYDIKLLSESEGTLKYFEYATHMCLTNYAMNGFYRELSTVIRDGLVLGYGVFGVIDDVEHDKIYYKAMNPFESYYRRNDHGDVECYARKFNMSAYDMWSLYRERTPDVIMDSYSSNADGQSLYECIELVCLNGALYDPSDRKPLKVGTQKYMRLVYCVDADCFLDARDIPEMPYSVFIWQDAGTHQYGKGMVEENAEDIVTLYETAKSRMELEQYMGNPAYNIPISYNGKFSSRPGARNIYMGQGDSAAIPTMVERPDIYSEYTNDIIDLRATLRSNMLVDIFQTILGGTDSRKTAYEVNIRKSEAAQMLTMAIGNESIILDYTFRRTLRIMIEKRMMAKPTEEIERFMPKVRLQFCSVFIQRMQSYYQVAGTQTLIEFVTAIYQLYPESLDVIDLDEVIRQYSVGIGASQYAIFERSETEEKRQQRAELAQQQMEAQQNQMLSEANRNNAQAQSLIAENGGLANAQ